MNRENPSISDRFVRGLLYLSLLTVFNKSFANACGDTQGSVKVQPPAVIFFAPSDDYMESLSSDERLDSQEMLADFYAYSGEVSKYLDRNNIKYYLTGSRFIEVKREGRIECIDLKNSEEPVGVILVVMNVSRLFPGLFIVPDMENQISKSFNLK